MQEKISGQTKNNIVNESKLIPESAEKNKSSVKVKIPLIEVVSPSAINEHNSSSKSKK